MLVALKDRHFLSIGATRFRRESAPLNIEDVDLGDLEIIDATLEVWLNSNDFDISYGYKLFADDHTRYAFGRTVGIIFGIDYFNIFVTDQNEERKYDVKYGYDGVFAGLIFAF